VGQTFSRLRELSVQSGDNRSLFQALWGLWVYHLIRGEVRTARALAEQLPELAGVLQDTALLIKAHETLGITLSNQGEFVRGLEHLERSLVLCGSRGQAGQDIPFGWESSITSRCFAAWARWALGYPDQAQATIQEALALARQLPQSVTLAHVRVFAAFLYLLRRDAQRALEQAEAGIDLCREQGFPFYLAEGTVWYGWALAEQGRRREGLEQIRQGLAGCRAMGAGLFDALMLGLLAEVLGRHGEVADGLQAVTEALAAAGRTGVCHYEAESHRVKGELLLQGEAPAAAAEACFRQALAVARGQQAKSWELRAALSLSRLYQKQGKPGQGRQLLADLYDWFTEGHDTADLREAREFLSRVPGP
jgi:predicted ATPase